MAQRDLRLIIMNKGSDKEEKIRNEINSRLDEIFQLKKEGQEFIPGRSKVNYAAAVYDENEMKSMVNSLLDGWFGMSKS